MTTISFRKFALVAVMALASVPGIAQAQKKSRDLITREEILASAQKDGDLFNAIKALRPHMLEMPRGIRSMGGTMGTAPLAVYVDKIRQPGGDVLQQILANTVLEVRYLDPNRSQNEFGITANGGAIVIKKYTGQTVADSLNKKPPR
jgi:hypothetical protein